MMNIYEILFSIYRKIKAWTLNEESDVKQDNNIDLINELSSIDFDTETNHDGIFLIFYAVSIPL